MDILELYGHILEAGKFTVDSKGFVSVDFQGSVAPVMVGGKRLVTPTKEMLTTAFNKDQVIFHPLSEYILRGESDVISKLRSAINIRLNYTIGILGSTLLTICSSTAEHHTLTPEQSEVLSVIKDVDENTLVAFNKILVNKASNSMENAFVHLFLKRSGLVKGKKYSRVGVVDFPFFEELKENKFTETKLRNKDRQAFLDLFEYLIPGIHELGYFNYGSNSTVAPFLDALMKTLLGVASKLNDVIELFKNKIDNYESLVFGSEWVDSFNDLTTLTNQIRQIPMQAGNEGSSRVDGVEVPVVKNEVAAVAQSPQQLAYQPPQPVVAQQFGQYPQHQTGLTGQVQQPMRQGIIETPDGLDFSSIVRNNPAFANVNNQYGRPQQQMRDDTPSWARSTPQQNNQMNNNNYPQNNYNNNNNTGYVKPGSLV